MTNEKKKSFSDRFPSRYEFSIVMVLLILLTALIVVGMILPSYYLAGDEGLQRFTESYVATITTVFGVWIGAGTAFFFGKESMKIAQQGMIEMKTLSPKERLINTKVNDFNPDKIEDTWNLDTTVEKIFEKLKDAQDWWFFVITNEDGKLVDVYEEEAFWRFATKPKKEAPLKLEILKTDTIKDVRDFLNSSENEKIKKKVTGIYRKVKADNTLAYVYELMDSENLRLVIVVDEKDIPTHYLTDSKIRKWMLKE